ncbi:hypothetical protein GQ44DRAFT_711469 [Phaeosphaeriaceae sp. PMI808]|nr:hypothetical protein GQ44DRAFT_711469 [Phaeosphaeriaceae sp. PMI808]
MAKFLANPGGDIWKDAEVELKLRLGRMREKLALDHEGKPQFHDPSLFKQEYKRLKFSLSKSEYAERLGELRSHNQALTRLTKQSIDLEPSRVESSKASSCPNFRALQTYARSLFDTLRSGLQCNSTLRDRHNKINDDDDLLESTPFRIIFTYESTETVFPPPWNEVNIKWIAERPQCMPLSSRTPDTFVAKNLTRRVRFDKMQIHQYLSSAEKNVPEQEAKISPFPGPEQIVNLCQAIAKLRQPQGDICAGYLLDGLNRKHGIYPLDAPASFDNQQLWSSYTLRQVLTKSAGFNRRLMQQDKFKIAVDLALSVLQLHKTPWLKDDWGGDDVYFVHRPGSSPTTIYQDSFIYRKISSIVSSQGPIAQTPVRSVIRNQTLFTLGTLLIELLYGKGIEELQTPHDLNCQGTPGTTWCTAERLIDEEIALEAGQPYSDAVRRCIRCDFNLKTSSLDDQDFQKAVFEGVVVPLETTLRRFNGQY